jgi:hypothetical protein
MRQFPDPFESQRMDIEEEYADSVEAAQKNFDRQVDSASEAEQNVGGSRVSDRDDAQRNFERDVADAADKRDAQLSQIYEPADGIKRYYPELRLLQDGPYQIMGLDWNPQGTTVSTMRFMPIYAGYTGANPFGVYGGFYDSPIPYGTYTSVTFRTANTQWVASGSPFFGPFHWRHRDDLTVQVMVRPQYILSRQAWGQDGLPPRLTPQSRNQLIAQAERYQRSLPAEGRTSEQAGPRSAYSHFTRPSASAERDEPRSRPEGAGGQPGAENRPANGGNANKPAPPAKRPPAKKKAPGTKG